MAVWRLILMYQYCYIHYLTKQLLSILIHMLMWAFLYLSFTVTFEVDFVINNFFLLIWWFILGLLHLVIWLLRLFLEIINYFSKMLVVTVIVVPTWSSIISISYLDKVINLGNGLMYHNGLPELCIPIFLELHPFNYSHPFYSRNFLLLLDCLKRYNFCDALSFHKGFAPVNFFLHGLASFLLVNYLPDMYYVSYYLSCWVLLPPSLLYWVFTFRIFLIFVGSWLSSRTHIFCKVSLRKFPLFI